ncbi:MAG: site-2 protease family protein [Ruminococcaceae bacterium]|nr:site-2 protease family protein [Oscillospiraceae bacterium]
MTLSALSFSPDYIVSQLLGIPGFVLFLCFRGFCQAWTARKLGDDTAYLMGYMSMNPTKHINLIGFIFILIFGFGFSNPVPVNTRKFKKIKRDNAIQILSAPVSGIILMIISTFLLYLLWFIGIKTELASNLVPPALYFTGSYNILSFVATSAETASVAYTAILCIIGRTALVSIFLAVFFMLPLPGLDGYNLIANFLPYKHYAKLYKIEKYSLFIFLGFIMLVEIFPGAYSIISVPANSLLNLFSSLFGQLFGIFI